MPQDFPLKLSVLWLGPAHNFTATECVFSLLVLPTVLLRCARSFLSSSPLNGYLPPRVSRLRGPRPACHLPDP